MCQVRLSEGNLQISNTGKSCLKIPLIIMQLHKQPEDRYFLSSFLYDFVISHHNDLMSLDFKARNFLPISACPPGEPIGRFGPSTGGTEELLVGAC